MVHDLPQVVIVVLNWNGWGDTTECVDSCLKSDYPSFSVTVVDNASTDGSEQILRERFPGIAVVQAGANLGYTGGNNVGIIHALEHGSDYVWILNNDTVVDPAALGEMIRAAESSPRAGMIGPKILLHSQPDQLNCIGATFNLRTG